MSNTDVRIIELITAKATFEIGGGRPGLFGYETEAATLRFQYGASPTGQVAYIALRNSANTFSGNQTIAGQLSATTIVTAGVSDGQVVQAGPGGLLRSDAGLLYGRTGATTRLLTLGNGAVASTVYFMALATATYNAGYAIGRPDGTTQWTFDRDGTTGASRWCNHDASGNPIDTPIQIVDGAGGQIDIGGSARPVNLTYDLRIGNTTRITLGGAATLVSLVTGSATISGLTAGRGIYVSTGGLLADSQYFTVDPTTGTYIFGGSQQAATYPGRMVRIVGVGSSYRSPAIELVEQSSYPSWAMEAYFGTLRFVRDYSNSPTAKATLDASGVFDAVGGYKVGGTTVVSGGRSITGVDVNIRNNFGTQHSLAFYHGASGSLRLIMRFDETPDSLDFVTRDDAGNQRNTPLSIPRTTATPVNAGGSAGQAWNFTGAIQVGGTQRISSGGAATLVSALVSGLAGTGVRAVVADGAGNLAAQAAATFLATIGGVASSGITTTGASFSLLVPDGSIQVYSTGSVLGCAGFDSAGGSGAALFFGRTQGVEETMVSYAYGGVVGNDLTFNNVVASSGFAFRQYVNTYGVFKVAGTQVVGARKTGWSTWTGAASRASRATRTTVTASSTYVQSEVTALMQDVQYLMQGFKAMVDDFHATAGHGLIG